MPADDPSGMLVPGASPPVRGDGETAESDGGCNSEAAKRLSGGVGDSPVRGTLVERDGGVDGAGKSAPLARGLEGSTSGVATLEDAGVGPSPSRAVTSLQAKRLASLARVDDRIRRRATSIVDSALRAPELADLPEGAITGPEAPKGWTKKQLRIAADATNSMKSAPAYLAMAQRVVESYKKAEADRPAAPTINAEVVQVHVSVANYPRRRLSEE